MYPALRIAAMAPLLLVLTNCNKEEARAKPATLVRTELVRLQPRQTVIVLTGDIQARVQHRTFLPCERAGHRAAGRCRRPCQRRQEVLARIDPTEQQADMEGAKAVVSAAEAQLKVATATFERQKFLMTSGFTTRATFDQAQEALRTAEGSLDAAKAQLGTARDALTYTVLRAGASGVITARNIEVGQVAQSGQSAFTLAQDGAARRVSSTSMN